MTLLLSGFLVKGVEGKVLVSSLWGPVTGQKEMA